MPEYNVRFVSMSASRRADLNNAEPGLMSPRALGDQAPAARTRVSRPASMSSSVPKAIM